MKLDFRTQGGPSYITKCTFQVSLAEYPFITRGQIPGIHLMKYVHMPPVNLIFAINLAIRETTHRFSPLHFGLNFGVAQEIIPHYRGVCAKDMIIVNIVCI